MVEVGKVARVLRSEGIPPYKAGKKARPAAVERRNAGIA